MGNEVAVGTKFDGKDKISGIFGRMWKAADKFGGKTEKAFNKASRSASGFGKITKGILAAGAVQKGLGFIQQGVSSVVTEFVQFDDAIVAAGARFKDIGPDSKNFAKDLMDIKKAARDAGAVTEFTAAQSAKALDFMAKAGFRSTTAMGSLRSMINLATATGEEFALVADMSSDLLGAFGLNADNAADKVKNLNRLNDVLVKTTNSANVTVENMFETMKDVGPIATGILGASLEEVSALTAVLGNSGIKGSIAMTALKNAYLNLAAPVGKGADMLKALNLTLDDGKGGAKKMTVLMKELSVKMQGLGKVKQAEILNVIFGKRAIAGSKNIMANIANIDKFEKSLLNAGGTSQKVANLMRTSLGNRLKALQSAAIETGFKFLDAFKGNGVGAIESLTKAFRNFDMKPVIEGVKSLAGFFKSLFNIVKPFLPMLPILIEFWITYSIVTKGLIALGMAKNFFLMVKAVQAATVAQGTLNTVMAMNPIGLIAVSVSVLVVSLYELTQRWDGLSSTMKIGAQVMSKILGPLSELWTAGLMIMDTWGPIKIFFANLWETFSELLNKPFFEALSTIFQPFLSAPANIMKHWEPVSKFFSGMFEKISKVTGAAGRFLGFGKSKKVVTEPKTKVLESKKDVLGSKAKVLESKKVGLGLQPKNKDLEQKEEQKEKVRAPNQSQIESRRGNIEFQGRMRFENPPPGSSISGITKGGPQVKLEELGANL